MNGTLLAKWVLVAVATLLLSAAKMPQFSYVGEGDKAPAFKVTTVAGDTINTEQLKGKVILVNFFATWCPPCKRKMPFLEQDVYQAIDHKDFVMVTIGREHSTQEVAEFKSSHGYTMPFAADPERAIYSQYAEKMIPRSVLIGRDGTIKLHSDGSSKADVVKIKKWVEKALNAS